MDNQFQSTIMSLSANYFKGMQLYSVLTDNMEDGTDIIICPAHIGDTLWICVFAEAYKQVHKCKNLLFVVPQSQSDLTDLFPSIDDTFPVTAEELLALEIYIG